MGPIYLCRDESKFCEWHADTATHVALPAAEFATLTREREDAEAQVEAMSHVLAATKADLASARTALAEARKALGNAIGTFRYGKEMCQTTRDWHEAVGDAKAEEWDDSVNVFSFAIKDTRDTLARIDAAGGRKS